MTNTSTSVRSRTLQNPPGQRGISFRPRHRHPTSTPTRLATRKISKCCRPVPDSRRQSVTARLCWGGGDVRRQGLANFATLAVTVRLPRRACRVACRRHIYSSAALSLCLAAAVGERGRVARGHCRRGCIVPATLAVTRLAECDGRSLSPVSRGSGRTSKTRLACSSGEFRSRCTLPPPKLEAVPSDELSVCLGPVLFVCTRGSSRVPGVACRLSTDPRRRLAARRWVRLEGEGSLKSVACSWMLVVESATAVVCRSRSGVRLAGRRQPSPKEECRRFESRRVGSFRRVPRLPG